MINEKILKQKLFEKSIIENRILKAHKRNRYSMLGELFYYLKIVEEEIKELENDC